MSSEIIAADVVAARRNDVLAVTKAHAAKLRGLQLITKLLANNAALSSLVNLHFDVENIPPSDSDEADWINKNSLINGCSFNDASLLYPSFTSYDASSLGNTAVFLDPPSIPCPPETAHVQDTNGPMPLLLEDLPSTQSRDQADPSSVALRVNDSRSGSPGIALAAVASPAPDEAASFSDSTKALIISQEVPRPAKTVHLPPENVQLEKMRERHDALEDEKAKSESDHSSRQSRLHSQNELASSPSSTIGALSAATPMPPQESPDTSPDSEAIDIDVLPPKDLLPSPEEQRAEKEHDRILAAQKDIAQRQARGDDEADPGEQLRWEEREAAAREAAERAAREKLHGPVSTVKSALDELEAEQVMEVVQETRQDQSSVLTSNNKQSSNATQSKPSSSVAEYDETITIARRNKALPQLNTTISMPTVPASPERSPHGDAIMRQKASRASSTTHPGLIDGQPTSPDSAVSPMTSRHPERLKPHRTPQRMIDTLASYRDPDGAFDLDELAALRGAAEDPERDYLEPLFRIQAHDAQGGPTKPLPNLVKDAAKYLSTQDQFATMQERLDYRILRRIYQLQNANKWSLRQMEKSGEPKPPVTHWDHMMSEMKWMRKDFSAERKMKKAVCAWLVSRCAEWVAADHNERLAMQVKVVAPVSSIPGETTEQLPELESASDSMPEDDPSPPTPRDVDTFPSSLIVPLELSDVVSELKRAGSLGKALQQLPIIGLSRFAVQTHEPTSMTTVSKFVDGKVLPLVAGPIRKRSRFEYEDDASILDGEPSSKKMYLERSLISEDEDVALFHPDNKHIRDRLHANNAFRPPSEFVMPSTSFYEFRNGSQWIWEDDQKLRKLAKEYSFNWSLIAEEMTLPSRYKSAAERRTPWECFERWVELETLPTEMRKTMYFKTWFQRLEQSQQAAERRHQAHVAAIQQAANGPQAAVPMRRRTIPSRVEKRKNSRYLWLVDAMRKHARKRESNAYKQAETQRAAAQRKAQADNNTQPKAGPMPTPQEFSARRYERDLQIQEHQRLQRQKMIEAQQKQVMLARASQQGAMPVAPGQQRAGPTNMQQASNQLASKIPQGTNMNSQLPPQQRASMPMPTHNGHLAVPQVGAPGVPQAQMRTPTHSNIPQQGIPNMNAQGALYSSHQFQMTNGATPSPGAGMPMQQQLQANQQQQMFAQMNAQTASNRQNVNIGATGQAMSNSPSMPPPPHPHNTPGQLSSGHVPTLFAIKNQLKSRHPNMNDDQLNTLATTELRRQSQNQNTTDARQSAMNAAAGLPAANHTNNMQSYAHNQNAFQNAHQIGSASTAFTNGDPALQPPNMNAQSPQAQQVYATQLRVKQMHQLRLQGSQGGGHAGPTGSPGVSHASPSMTPASPSVQYANMNGMAGMNGTAMGQRPPSRNNTPQLQRLGSSNMASGMQSPGSQNLQPQGSPHNMQASMAR